MRFFLEGGQVLELFEAGTAPGSPYIDIDNFTFKGFYRILQTGDGGVACQNMIVFVGDTAILKAQVSLTPGSVRSKGLLGNSAYKFRIVGDRRSFATLKFIFVDKLGLHVLQIVSCEELPIPVEEEGGVLLYLFEVTVFEVGELHHNQVVYKESDSAVGTQIITVDR